jgi:hypothetical protein
MTPQQQIVSNLLTLQERLQAAVPDIKTLLRDIHSQLKSDSAVVTCLSEDEIGILVTGLKKQTNTEISTTPAKKSSKKVTLDDI